MALINKLTGKEDCYWQYVAPGATFYVSMQASKYFPSVALFLFTWTFFGESFSN